jgi:hypothetical protein
MTEHIKEKMEAHGFCRTFGLYKHPITISAGAVTPSPDTLKSLYKALKLCAANQFPPNVVGLSQSAL